MSFWEHQRFRIQNELLEELLGFGKLILENGTNVL